MPRGKAAHTLKPCLLIWCLGRCRKPSSVHQSCLYFHNLHCVALSCCPGLDGIDIESLLV